MNCPSCGAPLEADALFCANCGRRLEASQPTSAYASPSSAQPSYSTPTYERYSSTPTYESYGSSAPQPYMPPTPNFTTVAPPNSSSAIVSLVFGILSWIVLPLIGAIVAIVAGHIARNEIKKSNGLLGGDGMALAGLILGYAHMVIVLMGCSAIMMVVIIGASMNN